jgi:glycosyltransferase involved in cell wall biosynthesis
MQLPLNTLAEHGHEVDLSYGWTDRARDFPIIIGQRVGKHDALPLWRRLATPGRRLVWETDDDVWHIDPSNGAAWMVHTPDLLDALTFTVTMSDLVTVSTEPLADVVRTMNPNVVVLPNHFDSRLLDIQRPRCDRVTIGWAGGDSHLRDFAGVAHELRRFLLRNPDVDFHNIGTSYLRPFDLPGRASGWVTDIWGYYRSIDFDVGIAPLADTTFNHSKSGIKALEYQALGIPVVASDSPAYRGVVLDGVTGYLVRHEYQWSRYLRELVRDEQMREEMGRKAREHARQWTAERGWPMWADAYASLA